MKGSQARPDEIRFIDEMELCFEALDAVATDQEPPDDLPGSDFAKDRNELPEEPTSHWARRLIVAAVDHMLCVRTLGGRPPAGHAEWQAHAPWTLMRASLEAASQAVWLMSPADSRRRVERLLRLIHQDSRDHAAAIRSTVQRRKRKNEPTSREVLDRAARLAARFGTSAVKIDERMNLLDCINEAARKSRVAPGDWAETLWRVASGNAHGRSWAHLAMGDIQEVERIDDQTIMARGLIDLEHASKLVSVSVGTIQYADWLFTCRTGRQRPVPELCGLTYQI